MEHFYNMLNCVDTPTGLEYVVTSHGVNIKIEVSIADD